MFEAKQAFNSSLCDTMEWVHCNNCYICPSSGHTFLFSSCGHIFCSKCVNKDGHDLCYVCKAKCGYLEINRSLKPEIQMFFKNPRDLLQQYSQNIKSVLEFQNFHRLHLQKHQSEKTNKVMKYLKQAQVEVTKRSELEKSIIVENKQLKSELDLKSGLVQSLESMIEKKDKELSELWQKYTARNKNKLSSLNTNTPISTLSFLNCATSTPINNEMHLFNGMQNSPVISGNLKHIFTSSSSMKHFDTPRGEIMNTPAMLGLSNSSGNNSRRSTPNRSKKSLF